MDNVKELSSKYIIHAVLILIIVATYFYMNNANKQNKKQYKKKYIELKQKIIENKKITQNKMQMEQTKYMNDLDSISDGSGMQHDEFEPQGIESDMASSNFNADDSRENVSYNNSILEKEYPRDQNNTNC
jgi:hypothetical protein